MLSAWRTSGLSMAAFAKARGLKEQRLSWWKKRLGEWGRMSSALAERTPRFVPAVVRTTRAAIELRARVTMRFADGTMVEIDEPERIGIKWLAELIAALRR